MDVRLNPISRKPGFSKTALGAALDAAAITYVHERALGNPRDNRDAFRRGDLDARQRMRALLESAAGAAAVQRLVDLARSGSVAVLCVEQSPDRCHRQAITEMVREVAPDVAVADLC